MSDDARDELDDSLDMLDVGDHVTDREDPDATMLVVALSIEVGHALLDDVVDVVSAPGGETVRGPEEATHR